MRKRTDFPSRSDISVTLSRLGRKRRLVLRFEWLTRWPICRVLPVSSQRHAMAILVFKICPPKRPAAHHGRRRTYNRRSETRQATGDGEVPANARKIIETTHSPTRHGASSALSVSRIGRFWAILYLQGVQCPHSEPQDKAPAKMMRTSEPPH